MSGRGRYASPKKQRRDFNFFQRIVDGASVSQFQKFVSLVSSVPSKFKRNTLANVVVFDVKKKKTLQANTSGNLS